MGNNSIDCVYQNLKILGCIFFKRKITFSPKQLMYETLNILATAITSFPKSWIEVLCSVWKLYMLMGTINIRLEFAFNLYSAYSRFMIFHSFYFISSLYNPVIWILNRNRSNRTHTHTHTHTHLCKRNVVEPL